MPSAHPQMSDSYGRIKVDEIENSGGDLVDLTAITTAVATTSAKGYMSPSDKTKLDGIEAGAEVNAVTSVNGETGAVTVQGFSGDYDDLTNKPTIPSSANDLSDIDLTGVQDGEVLKYNSTGSKFTSISVPTILSDGDIGDLADVDIDSNTLTNGDILTWNNTDALWENAQPETYSALSISYPSGNTIEEVTGGGASLDETFTNSGSGYEVDVLDYGGGEYAVIIKLAGSTIDAVVPNSGNSALNGGQIVTLTWNSGANTNTFIPNVSSQPGSDYRFDMWSDPNADPTAADGQFVTVNISSPPPTYVFNNGSAAQTALVTSPSASGKIDVGGVQYTISDFTDETLANGKLTVQYNSATTIAAGDVWREVPNNEATEGLLSYADASKIATLPDSFPFFETGVWVPRLALYDSGNLSDFYSHSMTVATGNYQRIGRMVFCTFNLMHPSSSTFGYSNGSATDRVYMADLPYDVGSNGFASSAVAIYSGLPAGMTGIPAVRSNAGVTEFVGLVDGAAATDYLDAQDLFQAQSVMQGAFSYFTDDTTYTVHSTATAY